MDKKTDKIILSEQNLSEYFYLRLSEVNKKSHCPLPQEFILYSSEVMHKYALAENYLVNDSKERVLGMEFLQAEQKSVSEKKEIYREIGDSVLFQLGVFPKRINKRSPSKSYYLNIGKSAYSKAAMLDCSFYDIPNFYNLLATSMESLIKLVTHVAGSFTHDSLEQYLLENSEAIVDFSFQKTKLAN